MDISHLVKILGEYPLFRDISKEEFGHLLEGHKFKNITHHKPLYEVDDVAESFAIVLSGAFKLTKTTSRGDNVIIYFVTPGELIGALVMLKPNATFPVSAVALGLSTVLVIPKLTYLKHWATNATIQAKLNTTIYSRMKILQQEKSNSMLSLKQRIVSLLLTLISKQHINNSHRLSIPLTRQEIADSVGSTVESVIRCMSDLSNQGIIQTEDKQIEIIRADKFVEILKNEN